VTTQIIIINNSEDMPDLFQKTLTSDSGPINPLPFLTPDLRLVHTTRPDVIILDGFIDDEDNRSECLQRLDIEYATGCDFFFSDNTAMTVLKSNDSPVAASRLTLAPLLCCHTG